LIVSHPPLFSLQNGYFTEKLISAVLARSIPVYGGFGAVPWVARYVNPARFIYCQFDEAKYTREGFNKTDVEARIRHVKASQADALAACVAKIKCVDEDDELYVTAVALFKLLYLLS
jgi:hypothetical protein